MTSQVTLVVKNPSVLFENYLHYQFLRIKRFLIKKKKKNPPSNAGDSRNVGSIPGSGRSPGIGNGNPLQYSCLENFMDRGAWQATVPGAAESWT